MGRAAADAVSGPGLVVSQRSLIELMPVGYVSSQSSSQAHEQERTIADPDGLLGTRACLLDLGAWFGYSCLSWVDGLS